MPIAVNLAINRDNIQNMFSCHRHIFLVKQQTSDNAAFSFVASSASR